MQFEEIAKFLENILLFQDLTEEQIAQIAGRCQSMQIKEGEVLFQEDTEPDGFYLIYTGSIHLTRGSGRNKIEIGTLIREDFFGEEAFLRDTNRVATAVCVEDAVLIKMRPSAFLWMIRTYPDIKEELELLVRSYRLSRKQNFEWIRNDETVHLISRKHIFLLYTRLVFPAFLMFLAVVVALFGTIGLWGVGPLLILLGGALLLLSLALGVWFYVDWGNDYYIITDQRVVWLEKVIAIYDSRQETPLNAVLSVNVRTDQLQRIIGSGDVIVRTYTGSIIMRSVSNPDQFVEMINTFWARAKELTVEEELDAMEEALHNRLHGLDRDQEEEEEAPKLPPRRRRGPIEWLFGNALKLRFEENDVITYRKHWILLVRKSWMPLLALAGMFVVLIVLYRPIREIGLGSIGIFLWMFLYTILVGWWFYHYLDWRNDIYQLTSDTILDIERRPLGREEKKTAPLESVLSLEHTRVGILGLLLNFGNVNINVGSSTLTFIGVKNPADVQHDVFDRMYSLKKKKENEEARRERQRMVEWLTIYHEEEQELREDEELEDPGYY
jgi:CRP-like cAMP-binding protein